MIDITVCYGASTKYIKYLQISLSTIPQWVPVIVVWYDESGILPDLDKENVKIVSFPTRLNNWQKSAALNLAVQHANTKWLLLADADLVFPQCFFPYLDKHLSTSNNFKIVYHFFVGRITQTRTSKIFLEKITWDGVYEKYEGSLEYISPNFFERILAKITHIISKKICIQFGAQMIGYERIYGTINPVIYSSSFFKELQGYDEKFVGWGGEDDDLERRTQNAGGIDIRIPLVVGHLWHPRIMDFKNYFTESTAYGNNNE